MNKKEQRYARIYKQLKSLCKDIHNPISRMSTIAAILHHKMDAFYWTGFYSLNNNGELLVGPYQGPLACLKLAAHTGVCWAGIDNKKTIIVDDVHTFSGHIACSSKSNSEIVVPVFNKIGHIQTVLDIDSEKFSCFDNTDKENLEKICNLIYN